jgi:hypothetical protein
VVFAGTAGSENVIAILNEAATTELVCMLRYKRRQFMAPSVGAAPVAVEFMAHAFDECRTPTISPGATSIRRHASRSSIAERS